MSTASGNGGGPFGRFSVGKNRTMPLPLPVGGWAPHVSGMQAFLAHGFSPTPELQQARKIRLVGWGFLPDGLATGPTFAWLRGAAAFRCGRRKGAEMAG
jgi:hypothetical protein